MKVFLLGPRISNRSDRPHRAVAPRRLPTTSVHSRRPQRVLEMGGQNDCACKSYLLIVGQKICMDCVLRPSRHSPLTIVFLHYYFVCQLMLSSNYVITIYWHLRPIISIIQLVNCILLSIAGIIQLNTGIHIERPAFPRYYGKFGKPEYLTAPNKKNKLPVGHFCVDATLLLHPPGGGVPSWPPCKT